MPLLARRSPAAPFVSLLSFAFGRPPHAPRMASAPGKSTRDLDEIQGESRQFRDFSVD
jgi:hypothetical protein